MHLLKGIGDIICRDLLLILELEELVTAMPGHVDENVRVLVSVETFRDGCMGTRSTWEVITNVM